jgi:hypothetical protein
MRRRPTAVSVSVGLLTLALTMNVSHGQRAGGAGAGAGRANPRTATITGRVVNAKGLPVPQAFVTALIPRPADSRGFQFFSARLGALTNDRGEYRLEALAFGEFYVIALPHNTMTDSAARASRAGYANTFHPGAIRLADAKGVVVKPGVPAIANIMLAPVRLSTVSGVVIAESGAPAGNVRLAITHGDGFFGLDSRSFMIGADGRFAIPRLQPGTYHLRFIASAWPPPRGEIPVLSGATVVVAGQDINNVRVVPIHMVRGTGRVVVATAGRPAFKPGDVRVGASPIDFDGNPGPQSAGVVTDKLTFEFKTWPSVGKIRVSFATPGWTVASITRNGANIADKPVTFAEGKVVSGIEITVRRQR